MGITITAICGDKSVSIECKRPSWESVRDAYKEINGIFKSEYDKVKKNSIGLKDIVIETLATKAGAKSVFEKIGGEPYKEFLNNEAIIKRQETQGLRQGEIQRYTLNSCALRVSYALNHSYLLGQQYLIKNQKLPDKTKPENKRWLGADNNIYYLSIYGVRNFLTSNWGNSDKPYNLRTFKDKNEVKSFYDNEFSKFNKSGIVVMRIGGWSDAGGHTTLWNGEKKEFEDIQMYDRATNYLNGKYNVKDFQFWELK